MCTMYVKFGQMLNSLIQKRPPLGNDFIDCCLEKGLSPADAEEILQEQLGFDGDEFLSVLLK